MPLTTNTAGVGRTTRRGPGCSNPDTAPTSKRRGSGPAQGLESKPRDLIRDYLLQRVEHGTVRNRADVVAALREAGLEVPRQGKNYITALDPETGDRWRPKGELYGLNFDRERFDRAAAEAAGKLTQGDRGVDRERARAARRELAARREERALNHRARY